jgi:hypothetical protein
MVFVFAFTTDAIEVDADPTMLFVFALTLAVPAAIADPSEDEAVAVFALTTKAIEEDAEPTTLFVFAFTLAFPAVIAEAIDEEAEVTSDCVASDPDVRPAPVSVRVPLDQTSAARVPNAVSVRVLSDQTLVGIEAIEDVMVASVVEMLVRFAPSEEDAAVTTVLVFPLTTAATEDVAI